MYYRLSFLEINMKNLCDQWAAVKPQIQIYGKKFNRHFLWNLKSNQVLTCTSEKGIYEVYCITRIYRNNIYLPNNRGKRVCLSKVSEGNSGGCFINVV